MGRARESSCAPRDRKVTFKISGLLDIFHRKLVLFNLGSLASGDRSLVPIVAGRGLAIRRSVSERKVPPW